jgi:phenylacetate-CoA ligase
MIYNEKIECLDKNALADLQSERLQAFMKHVSGKSVFYRKMLSDAGIDGGTIKTIGDIVKLPFTRKEICVIIIPSAFFRSL